MHLTETTNDLLCAIIGLLGALWFQREAHEIGRVRPGKTLDYWISLALLIASGIVALIGLWR